MGKLNLRRNILGREGNKKTAASELEGWETKHYACQNPQKDTFIFLTFKKKKSSLLQQETAMREGNYTRQAFMRRLKTQRDASRH